MSDTFFVRLKAYDPRRGHVLRRFAYRGIKLYEDRGWYRVEAAVADYLRTVRQVASLPHSALAFDVHTEAEAKEIEARETADKTTRASPLDTAPIVTTPEDVQRAPRASGRR